MASIEEIKCDLLVLGAGPGGYAAAFRAADLGASVVLVERDVKLGGVCLNVGCIPSKALLDTVGSMHKIKSLQSRGIKVGAPEIDLAALRNYKSGVVDKLTSGLEGMARARRVTTVTGTGKFANRNRLVVEDASGKSKTVVFEKAIIAAGSRPARIPILPDDKRIVDSTGALELPFVPDRMLVIGGGIIGLEMGTIYAGLGARVDLVEMTPDLMPGVDRDLVAVWQKSSAGKFASIMTGTRVTSVEAKPGGIYVRFEGQAAPNAPETYDLVLVAVGRVANGLDIGGDKAGIKISENGQIPVDSQMRTNVPHIFAIGDIVGGPMLAHKAAHEGHIAAEAAMGHEAHMDAQQIPNVAYTDPEIAWTGKTESQCMAEGLDVEVATFPWMASGRALASSSGTGLTKLIFERQTGFLVGGGIVGAHAGELLGEVCLAIEMGSTAEDIAGTIHPHPTLVEGTARAAEIYLKTCTDLPPARGGR